MAASDSFLRRVCSRTRLHATVFVPGRKSSGDELVSGPGISLLLFTWL